MNYAQTLQSGLGPLRPSVLRRVLLSALRGRQVGPVALAVQLRAWRLDRTPVPGTGEGHTFSNLAPDRPTVCRLQWR